MSETKSSKQNSLYCKVCDLNLQGPSEIEAHFTGKRHQKKIRYYSRNETHFLFWFSQVC